MRRVDITRVALGLIAVMFTGANNSARAQNSDCPNAKQRAFLEKLHRSDANLARDMRRLRKTGCINNLQYEQWQHLHSAAQDDSVACKDHGAWKDVQLLYGDFTKQLSRQCE